MLDLMMYLTLDIVTSPLSAMAGRQLLSYDDPSMGRAAAEGFVGACFGFVVVYCALASAVQCHDVMLERRAIEAGLNSSVHDVETGLDMREESSADSDESNFNGTMLPGE